MFEREKGSGKRADESIACSRMRACAHEKPAARALWVGAERRGGGAWRQGARALTTRGGEDAALREDLARSRERVDDGARCESDGHDLVLSELGPNDHVPGWDKLVVYGKHVIWSDREGGGGLGANEEEGRLEAHRCVLCCANVATKGVRLCIFGMRAGSPPPLPSQYPQSM